MPVGALISRKALWYFSAPSVAILSAPASPRMLGKNFAIPVGVSPASFHSWAIAPCRPHVAIAASPDSTPNSWNAAFMSCEGFRKALMTPRNWVEASVAFTPPMVIDTRAAVSSSAEMPASAAIPWTRPRAVPNSPIRMRPSSIALKNCDALSSALSAPSP